jgi:hypothetical protein
MCGTQAFVFDAHGVLFDVPSVVASLRFACNRFGIRVPPNQHIAPQVFPLARDDACEPSQ